MQLSLWISMLRKLLALSVASAQSWWRPWALASVLPSMILSVMLWLKRTIMLSMLLLRAVRGPLRRVLHSPELQLHRGLPLVHLPRMLSSVPRRRSLQLKLGFTRHIQCLCQKVVLVKAALVSLPATCLARTVTKQVIGPGTVHILRRMPIKVAVRGMFIIIALKKFHLVRLSLLVSS
jgi:hypothetical protein